MLLSLVEEPGTLDVLGDHDQHDESEKARQRAFDDEEVEPAVVRRVHLEDAVRDKSPEGRGSGQSSVEQTNARGDLAACVPYREVVHDSGECQVSITPRMISTPKSESHTRNSPNPKRARVAWDQMHNLRREKASLEESHHAPTRDQLAKVLDKSGAHRRDAEAEHHEWDGVLSRDLLAQHAGRRAAEAEGDEVISQDLIELVAGQVEILHEAGGVRVRDVATVERTVPPVVRSGLSFLARPGEEEVT